MHRRVLADRVEHHRVLELGRHLADDVDALGLELLQMRQQVSAHAPSTRYPVGREPRDDERRRLRRPTSRRVSIVKSASDGGSYGSDTPVKFGSEPARAFAYSPFGSRRLADLERRGHVHEEEAAERLDHAPHLAPAVLVRSDDGADDDARRAARSPRRPTRCAARSDRGAHAKTRAPTTGDAGPRRRRACVTGRPVAAANRGRERPGNGRLARSRQTGQQHAEALGPALAGSFAVGWKRGSHGNRKLRTGRRAARASR